MSHHPEYRTTTTSISLVHRKESLVGNPKYVNDVQDVRYHTTGSNSLNNGITFSLSSRIKKTPSRIFSRR